jgi:tetratricopeptide (TPR) repeat protein
MVPVYLYLSVKSDISKAYNGKQILTAQEFYDSYALFLNQFIKSCMDKLWERLSFLEISADEKKLFMEFLMCSFYRVNGKQINRSLSHYAQSSYQSNDILSEKVNENEDAVSSWREDFITLPLLRYMAQSNDKDLREEGVQKLLCCGKDLIEARQYENALSHYREIKSYLREGDARLKKALAQALWDYVKRLIPYWNNLDNKKIRLLTFSAVQQASEFEPVDLSMNHERTALLINAYINVDRTVEAVSFAERLNGDSPFAQFILAHALRESGRYSEAVAIIQSFVQNKSDNLLQEVHFLYSLADCYHLQGSYDQAISTLKTILSFDDDQILTQKYFAYSRLCWIYGDLGEYSTAIVLGEEASSLYSRTELPEFRPEYVNLGVVYIRMEDYDTA